MRPVLIRDAALSRLAVAKRLIRDVALSPLAVARRVATLARLAAARSAIATRC
jgi:hypothetical protein